MRCFSLRPFCPRCCNPFGKIRPLDAHHSARQAVWQAIPLTCDAPTRYHGLHSRISVSSARVKMFIDQASLRVRGGKGGNGCCSFRREKYIERGGPDGGNGGHGGSVFLRANANLATLLDFPPRPVYAAGNGGKGGGGNCSGKNGQDLSLDVPPGTIVRDAATGLVLRDLVQPGDIVCVARGGKGGFGNKHFATSVNRAPRQWEKGQAGEERTVDLELKLIADVGLVGLPNAGKSSLLSRVSAAHPKIAAYPFTTLEPQLGIADMGDARPIVIADLPGLIEGAHAGHGLGDEFLRHIERTRVICHVVDIAPLAGPDPVSAYRAIRKELQLYSRELARRRHIIAANKMDLTDAEKNLRALKRAVRVPVFPISAVTGTGLGPLLRALAKEVAACS
jgi:GTP-binding protein